MDCFIDHIGLSYCESENVYNQPASGIYLNTLPGISIESIDKIADAEQVTYKGVWDDVQKSAIRQFKIDVIFEIQKCYQLTKDCNYEDLICENIEELTLAWQYCLAVWLMIFRLNSNRINRWTTIDREQAKDLREYYQAEYEKALRQGVQLMNTESCKLCCGGNPQIVTWLP